MLAAWPTEVRKEAEREEGAVAVLRYGTGVFARVCVCVCVCVCL